MTAFQEDFLQTIVNVSWPTLKVQFKFLVGGGFTDPKAIINGRSYPVVAASTINIDFKKSDLLLPQHTIADVICSAHTSSPGVGGVPVTSIFCLLLDSRNNVLANQTLPFPFNLNPNQFSTPTYAIATFHIDFSNKTITVSFLP